MALRQAGVIFRGEAVSSLVIIPRANEGLRIRRVHITNPSGGTVFATFINDTARVGFFRVVGYGGRHLIARNEIARGTNLLDYMIRQLGFSGYPVVQGVGFTISLSTGTADIFVVADSYDAADIKEDQPNGSKSADLTFVNYGTNLAAIAAAGYNKLDSRQNPAEMMAFPFGARGAALVPAGRRCTFMMLGGQAVGRFVSAGNTMANAFLRMKKGVPPAETLLDRGDAGYPFIGTVPGAAGADYTSVRQVIPSSGPSGLPADLIVDDLVAPTLEFGPNDELAIEIQNTLVGAGQLNASDIDVWAVLRVFPA